MGKTSLLNNYVFVWWSSFFNHYWEIFSFMIVIIMILPIILLLPLILTPIIHFHINNYLMCLVRGNNINVLGLVLYPKSLCNKGFSSQYYLILLNGYESITKMISLKKFYSITKLLRFIWFERFHDIYVVCSINTKTVVKKIILQGTLFITLSEY